jgi:hypothetical protein
MNQIFEDSFEALKILTKGVFGVTNEMTNLKKAEIEFHGEVCQFKVFGASL